MYSDETILLVLKHKLKDCNQHIIVDVDIHLVDSASIIIIFITYGMANVWIFVNVYIALQNSFLVY